MNINHIMIYMKNFIYKRGERDNRGWDGWLASFTHGLEFEQTGRY